jgi:Zn-dependent protease with chaperone function
VGVWLLLASLLWHTTVPAGLHVPRLNERDVFGAGLVRRAVRFERFLDWVWVLATLAGLVAYIVMARRGRPLARSLGLGSVNAGIVLGVVTFTVVWAATLPFALADVWWERRHGISRESYVQAVTNEWLALLGRTIVAVIALAVVLAFARRLGRRWWLAATPAIAGILLVLQLFAPYLASLGTQPVRPPRLRAEIRALERREHAGRPPVRVDHVSGQTTVANAFSIGIGPTKRVILWNTLLDGRFTLRQVAFVVGHELGHVARNHVLRGVGWFALLVLPVLAVTAYATDLRRPEAVPLALLVIALAQLAILPLQNAISRRYEREADWIGLNGTRDPAAARGLFVGFVRTSLQDPSPPGWVHVMLDDHPTPLQRVEMARAWELRH